MPLIERLRVKSLEGGERAALLLRTEYAELDQLENEFWLAFEGLDREALLRSTLQVLAQHGKSMTLAELAQALPPGEHDLETVALWLAMACEVGLPPQCEREHIDTEAHGRHWRFDVPRVSLDGAVLASIDWEL